ncbi:MULTISPECIES: hypothetical protein [Longicatena]|nr:MULTISPECIES: hypothetical protein [Longicatena]MCB6456241.1 hypothetical protein [Longicatena sp. 210702-DFI.1.253]MCB7259100.1 hypothetical protein [Longicatena sp. 210702-DFI.1.177]MCC2857943.1 hypothetical protein [Longicatena sp. 210702-DFI.1.204]MCQ5284909.1 hypothetical protein [Longicatena caecimuris]MCQ5292005.1 hypothetical protein [Longicatena caecimuris]
MACFNHVELANTSLPDEILLQIDNPTGFYSFTTVSQIRVVILFGIY